MGGSDASAPARSASSVVLCALRQETNLLQNFLLSSSPQIGTKI